MVKHNGSASARTNARAYTPSPPTHLHPAPVYAGPASPDCTWGVPAHRQQLQQVTTSGGYASIQKMERGRRMPSQRREEKTPRRR